MKRTLMITAAICAVLCIGTNAQALTKYFCGGGSWNTGTWRLAPGCPSGTLTTKAVSGDHAVIQANCYLDQNEICGSFEIDPSVHLYLDSMAPMTGYTLTVDDTTGANSTVNTNGIVYLRDNTSKLEFLYASPNIHTLAGAGSVQGRHDSSKIRVATAGTTLTSTTNIEGHLEITGYGNFTNQGTVNAKEANGTLLITVGGTLADTAGDRWKVSNSGSVLQIDSTIGTIGTLDGNFKMTSGDANSEMRIGHSLGTNGKLEISVGTLIIDPNDAGGSNTVTFDVDYVTTPTASTISGTATIVVAPGETLVVY